MRSLAAAFVVLLAGCAGPTTDGPGSVGVPPIETPAAPGSVAPNLAAGADGRLYLSWVEPTAVGHALRAAVWDDGRWSNPGTVATGDDWFVNWADVPSLAALADGTLAAHWLVKSAEATYAYDVHVARSRDGGASWDAPLVLHDDGTPTEHGFVSIVPLPEGAFRLVWLDGRLTGGAPAGPMTLRSAVLPAEGEPVEESVVDGRVCDCCSTDAVRTTDGSLLVAYRDRSEAEVRDIAIARSDGDGWSPPRTVHDDGWTIAGCPVNGPALAGHGDRVVLAWFTAPGNDNRVNAAFSDDGGRTWGPALRIDEGDPIGRVDAVLLDDGGALVSWVETDGGAARVLLRRVGPDGPGETLTVARTGAGRSSGVPRLARVGEDVVVAWTDPGEPSRILTAFVRAGRRTSAGR